MASASQDKAISVTLGGEGSNEAITGAPPRLSQNRTKPRRDFFFFFFLKKLYWDLSKLQQVETRDRLLGPTETGFIALKSNRTIKSSVCKSTVLLRLQLAGNFWKQLKSANKTRPRWVCYFFFLITIILHEYTVLNSLRCFLWTISFWIHNISRKREVEIVIPILWKKKPRLRIAKWFSETTWVVSRELKIKFRSCLSSLPLSSSSEGSLTFLEVVKHFSYFPPYGSFFLGVGRKQPPLFCISVKLSKPRVNQGALPHIPFQYTFTLLAGGWGGADLGGYTRLIWNLK